MQHKKEEPYLLGNLKEEEVFRLLFQSAMEGFAIVNKAGVIVLNNPGLEVLFGYGAGKLRGKNIGSIVPYQFRDQHQHHLERFHKKPQKRPMGIGMDLLGLKKDGTEIPIEVSLSYLQVNGELYAVAYVTDISKRKRMEASLKLANQELEKYALRLKHSNEELEHSAMELKQSRAWLAEAQMIARLGSWEWDIDTNVFTWSDQFYRNLGYEPEEVEPSRENFLAKVAEEDQNKVSVNLDNAIKRGQPFSHQYRVCFPNGSRRVMAENVVLIQDSSGKPAKLFGSSQDVTLQKKTEDALRAREAKFREMMENLPAGAVFLEGDTIGMNKAAENIIGFKREEITTSDQWFSKLHGEKSSEFKTMYEDWKGQGFPDTPTVPVTNKRGEQIWVRFAVYQEERFTVWLLQDVTQQKNAEEALRKEKEIARMYLDMAGSMIIALDAQARVTLINQKGCDMLEYEERDILGKDWLEHFIPPSEKEQVGQVFQQLIGGGKNPDTEYFENGVLTRSGSVKVIEWHNTLIRNQWGNPIGMLGSGIDITGRLEMDKVKTNAILQGQEQERKRLAKELHDGLVQTLSAISLNLKALEEHLHDLPVVETTAYNNAMKLLDEAIIDTRNLSHDLLPSVLEHYGLIKAVSDLVDKMNSNKSIRFTFEYNVYYGEFNKLIEIGIYRIIQELVQNIVKHSRADFANIELAQADGFLEIKIEDNGVGFEGTMEEMQSNGIGLRNVVTRVRSLNGIITLDSTDRKGTTVKISVPLP